ncbi:MAG: alpha/beta fold hydrolase [Gemmatimonadales bacterium]
MILSLAVLSLVSCSAPCLGSFTAQDQPADTMISVGHHRLHFRTWGGPSDLAVVFEAGGGSDIGGWHSVPALLAAKGGIRVVAYDRAGMGQSELGPRTLTPFAEIRHLGEALKVLGIKRAILVGHSYGGMLSLLHAAQAPERIVGLVLVDPMNPIFIEAVTMAWLSTTVPDIADPKTPREVTVIRMKETMPAFADSASRALAAVRAPTIVITAGILWFGRAAIDSAWRQSHESLARGANRELVVATQSKHGIPESEPDLIVSAIERMLSRVGAGARR